MFKNHPRALYVTWLVILLALPFPLIFLLNTSLVDTTVNLLLYDIGIMAYVWWLAIVYLSTRPQWLDRLIGLPAMYFVHGMLGVLALIGAFVHQQFLFSMHWEISITGQWAWYLAIFGTAYASFFMSGWFVDRLPVARRLKNRLQVFFKHELSLWIHRLNFVMIFLIWLHVHFINRIAILSPFMMLFDLYTIYFVGTYVYYKYVVETEELIQGKLIGTSALSPTVQELKIQVPDDHVYQAGDFYFLRFPDAAISQDMHPFSVASAPSKDGSTVTFIIQGLGDFTKAVPQLPVGTRVELEGPFGRFAPIIAEDQTDAPIILYGLGSGIAPLKSLSEELVGKRNLHIIWSAKSEEERYFDQDFRELSQWNPEVRYDGKAHRFTEEELVTILSPEEIARGLFFIVGSAPALLMVEETLKGLGVARGRLHDERLTM
ncbi:FAD-binding oxidoreductase [Streptococcus sp. NLN76]|uniref:FAD-binding oxidoreductase n=1 Tax=Streptococcus sp. NLN76 TaxID=2822800 RepID=UPI0018A9CA35|nr:FAD-binding oxidoreductase [Streptococcus sp. NLN76]MBF8970010.1 iron reductase [Streptococcus sp. NLN76]